MNASDIILQKQKRAVQACNSVSLTNLRWKGITGTNGPIIYASNASTLTSANNYSMRPIPIITLQSDYYQGTYFANNGSNYGGGYECCVSGITGSGGCCANC